jgi:NAD(P)-dependent dehydrogenase (short-subunit alcohol dehydrogenase family)
MRLSNKVAIITGSASGMGQAAAELFAQEGASVVVTDISAEMGEATVRGIRDAGGKAIFVQANVAAEDEVKHMVNAAIDAFGRVDVLYNNAGIMPEDDGSVTDLAEATWDRILDVNLKSYFLMSKYAIPEIRRRGGGAVINTASVQGLQSQRGVPAYAASKGGVLSLTRQMALDYASEHIRVLAVCPGTIDTEMARASAAREPDGVQAALERYGRAHPIGRIGTGQDIANVVVFLASAKASFMTGEYVCVDGGYMALGAWAGGAGNAATSSG